jgi:hypothetical protein
VIRPRSIVAVALAGVVAGSGTACGGDPPPGPPVPAPPATGYFVGRTADGLGIAVDLAGFDPTAQRVSRVLLDYPRPVALAIVAVVNSGEADAGQPQLAVRTRSERMVPLVDVRVLLGRIPGAASLAAARRVPLAGVLAPGASSLRYLAAEDVAPQDVTGVRAIAGDAVLELSEERR